MTFEQIASLQPALAAMLKKFRHCFKRDRTFGYWQTYILGLMSDVKRKSIEPIALSADVPVRTLQEFLSFFKWDHERIDAALGRLVAEEHGCDRAIGVIDASGHAKKGDKTPGVQRQWCGESGKVDNCIVGQHLVYTDNDPANASLKELLEVAFARWHVEKWFERAKQEAGFGAFEVRTYTSLIRHWLSSRMAMFFLACQTQRLRGEKSADHVRAGSRRGQCAGGEDMAILAPFVRGPTQELRVLPMA